MLFRKVSIFDVLENVKQRVKQTITSLDPNYVLNASEEDLVRSLVAEFTLDVPTIDESGIHVDYGEKQIDISSDPRRMIFARSKPFYVAGTQVTFIVPFIGDALFFDVQPQSFTYGLGGSAARVANGDIQFTYAAASLDGAGAKREFETELQHVKQNLQNLKTAVDRHNGELEQQVRQQLRERKDKLLRDAQMAASIGYPIKRREGVPVTYAVPVQKRQARIERPPASSGPFQPEPVLAGIGGIWFALQPGPFYPRHHRPTDKPLRTWAVRATCIPFGALLSLIAAAHFRLPWRDSLLPRISLLVLLASIVLVRPVVRVIAGRDSAFWA